MAHLVGRGRREHPDVLCSEDKVMTASLDTPLPAQFINIDTDYPDSAESYRVHEYEVT